MGNVRSGKRLFIVRVWILFCLSVMSPAGVWGDEEIIPSRDHCITRFPNGDVNWSTGKVYVRGKAAPGDQEETKDPDFISSVARSDARRHLIDTLKRIQITGSRRVGDLAAADDHFLAGIETLAKNVRMIAQSYTSNYSMEVVLEATLYGGFLQLVLPEAIRHIPTLKIIDPIKPYGYNARAYTGLIIDATGTGFQPVLYPVVISELGTPVYSALFISREFAVQRGVCRYTYNADALETAKWVGPHPIKIKGLRKGGTGNGSIVVSRADADAMEDLTERHAFMRECRVVILLAPAPEKETPSP